MEINIKDFKKWIKTLRSGKYQQSSGALENDQGYCCLGVACKVLIPKNKLNVGLRGQICGVMPEYQPFSPAWLVSICDDFREKTNIYLYELNDNSSILISEYVGEEFEEYLYETTLEKFTFDEIADILELVYIHKILD